MHVKEKTSTLLKARKCSSRNCTEIVLKPLPAKTASYFTLVYCSFPIDYTISVYMMTNLHSCTLRDYLHSSDTIFDKLE